MKVDCVNHTSQNMFLLCVGEDAEDDVMGGIRMSADHIVLRWVLECVWVYRGSRTSTSLGRSCMPGDGWVDGVTGTGHSHLLYLKPCALAPS